MRYPIRSPNRGAFLFVAVVVIFLKIKCNTCSKPKGWRSRGTIGRESCQLCGEPYAAVAPPIYYDSRSRLSALKAELDMNFLRLDKKKTAT